MEPDRQARAVGYATTAYRADLAGRREPIGEHDGEWLAIASLLEQAARLPESNAVALLRQAERLAADIVSPVVLENLVRSEWQNAEIHPADAIVAIADEAQNHSAFRISAHILDSLLAASLSLSDLQRGRVLVRRARTALKLGEVDGAADRFAQVLRLGRALNLPDLIARGWVGRAYVAHLHGNYPEVWRCARRAARIADRHRFRMISHYAHNWLMVAAAVSGRMDDALAHGWLSYQAAAGAPLKELEVLVNVSQALLDCGHAREARAGFMAAIATEHLTAHAALPALGGIAMASAMLDDERRVLWVAREIDRLERAGARPRLPRGGVQGRVAGRQLAHAGHSTRSVERARRDRRPRRRPTRAGAVAATRRRGHRG